MSTSQSQSSLSGPLPGTGTTFGPNSNFRARGTPQGSVGSTTAAGHGPHPYDDADTSNVNLPNTRIGPQQEDLDGEQMCAPGEGEVMQAQFNKNHMGFGEEESLTSDLDRKKAEQQEKREAIHRSREQGLNVDGDGMKRLINENLNDV